MAYIDYAFYVSLYGEDVKEADFNRYAFEASRILDINTSGIDNVKKLAVAFPTKEDDIAAVKHCACQLIRILKDMEEFENAYKFSKNENGASVSSVVSSISSGSESISYATNMGATSAIAAAVSDYSKRRRLFEDTVINYLSGVEDANGVNLLYGGIYPMRVGGGIV